MKSSRQYQFTNLLVDREEQGWLHLHFKPVNLMGGGDVPFQISWQFGDLREPDTLTQVGSGEFPADRFSSIPVPNFAVNSKGTLYVRIANDSLRNTMMFEGADSFELLLDIGTFHWNLFRALAIVWCRLAFLAVLGLLASSFLSFPVACMICLLVLMVSSSAGFLGEAIEWSTEDPSGDDPLWVVGPVLRPLAKGFIWLVPDFSKFDPVGNVVGGRLVPLMWVLQSIAVLILIKGLVLGVLGCVILTKRELARVVV